MMVMLVSFLVLNVQVDISVLLSMSEAQSDGTARNFRMYVIFNGWIPLTFQQLYSLCLGALSVEIEKPPQAKYLRFLVLVMTNFRLLRK